MKGADWRIFKLCKQSVFLLEAGRLVQYETKIYWEMRDCNRPEGAGKCFHYEHITQAAICSLTSFCRKEHLTERSVLLISRVDL